MIILIVVMLAFIEDYIKVKQLMMLYIIVGLFLILYAGFRPVGFDRDSLAYESLFMNPDSKFTVLTMEPLFLVICRTLYAFVQDVRILFLFFAMLGVSLNVVAIKRLCPMYFFPLLIYFSNFYMVHELTQIRAGVAVGIFLFAIKPIIEGRKLRVLLLIFLSSMFHYSSLALLPMLFLSNNDFDRISKYLWASIVPICIIMYFFNVDILTSFPLPFVSQKVEIYKTMSEFGSTDRANMLNPFTIFRMVVFLYLLYFSKTVSHYVPCVNVVVRMLGCSILIYCIFSSVKVIGTRLSELYAIAEIVAYPCIIYTIRPKFVGEIMVFFMSCVYLYFNLFQWQLFNFE